MTVVGNCIEYVFVREIICCLLDFLFCCLGWLSFNLGPMWWMLPFFGNELPSTNYWTHELHDELYRDPLIQPESVCLVPTTKFINQCKVRKERYEKDPDTLYY